MCNAHDAGTGGRPLSRTIPVAESVGTVLAHDVTEIRPGAFKGCAFQKGHVIRQEDIGHLQRLGKEHLFVLQIASDEMHEDDAAYALARALAGDGAALHGTPREGRINITAVRDGLLKVDRDALRAFNMLGEIMCATLHDNTVVRKGQVLAGTRAIPLVVKKALVEEAVRIAEGARSAQGRDRSGAGDQHEPGAASVASCPQRSEMFSRSGVIEVREIRRPRAGVVITGNEVYHGRIKDAFAPVIARKIEEFDGEIIGTYYAPDDQQFIEDRLRELIAAGADLLITTGGMSVDPDDVTRFAIRSLGAEDITYGSAVLPGAMVLVAYVSAECGVRNAGVEADSGERVRSELCTPSSEFVPILGIPACGMYHKATVLDLVLPRLLSGERIAREALAELGHGGLCLHCTECRYPVCPFGK